MYILGDIGNTETKLCIVSKNNKILKKTCTDFILVLYVRTGNGILIWYTTSILVYLFTSIIV